MGRIDLNNSAHMEAAKNATCAQVEYWFTVDESMSIMDNLSSFSLGSFSASFEKKGSNGIAKRAKMYLSLEGLLYKGVNPRCVYPTSY